MKKQRPLLTLAAAGNAKGIEKALEEEEKQERDADRNYWLPLIAELEQIRHKIIRHSVRENSNGTV